MGDKNKIIYSSSLFGEYSPYCAIVDGKAKIYDTIGDVIRDTPHLKYELDIAAVLSLLNFNYILGDRTLIANVSKVPWHSDITIKGKVIRKPPITHDNNLLDEKIIAKRMYDLLREYLYRIITRKHSVIWLTLSGGYDSRIIAAIIKEVATKKNEIRVLNWGIPNSRDVVYAKKIADHYGWEYFYIPYDHRSNIDLIKYAVEEGGAEVSAIDYNPIEINPSILTKISPDDAIIFAHYGDSIGRASYGGKHISNIRLRKIHNPYFLFNTKNYIRYKKVIERDREQAWITDRSKQEVKAIAINELDMHENYMRRMLTKRFRFCKKYDPYTNNGLVQFVYSISPVCRNDKVYAHILEQTDRFLYELPWAKTGISFSGIEENDNFCEKQHDKLRDFLNFYDEIRDCLLGGNLVRNNIINKEAVDYILSLWPRDWNLSAVLSKLYGIELFINRFDLDVPMLSKKQISHVEAFLAARCYNMLKKLKNRCSPPQGNLRYHFL